MKEGQPLNSYSWREIAELCSQYHCVESDFKCEVNDMKGHKLLDEASYVPGFMIAYNGKSGYWFYHPGFRLAFVRVAPDKLDEQPALRGIFIREATPVNIE